jgi:hypothetical protein
MLGFSENLFDDIMLGFISGFLPSFNGLLLLKNITYIPSTVRRLHVVQYQVGRRGVLLSSFVLYTWYDGEKKTQLIILSARESSLVELERKYREREREREREKLVL